MHKLLATLAVAVVGMAIVALPTASAGDKNCPDFATQKRAQFFFLKHGGPHSDPDRLDADSDGVACEDNPCPCYRKKHLPNHRLDTRREGGAVLRL
jgi:hypothetical protein